MKNKINKKKVKQETANHKKTIMSSQRQSSSLGSRNFIVGYKSEAKSKRVTEFKLET